MLVAERSMVVNNLLRLLVSKVQCGESSKALLLRRNVRAHHYVNLGFMAPGNHAAFKWYSGREGPDQL